VARHVQQGAGGWPALRERALQWPPSVRPGLRHHRRRGARAGARLRHHDAGGDPPELRHAARARRRQCGAPGRAAALPDRGLAAARRRPAAVGSSGWFRGARRRRAAAARPAGRAPAAHHQHGHHRRRPAARGLARLRPEDRGGGGLQQQPGGGGAESAKVVRGFQREDLFTVVLEHFLTDTADHADYVLPATTQLEHLGHARRLRPHLCADQPAGHRAAGPGAAEHRDLPRAGRAHGFDEPCFADSDEQMVAQAWKPRRWTPRNCTAGWVKLALPEAPFADGGFHTADGRARVSDPAAGLGLPDHVPNHECAEATPALAARYPLAMISPPARHFLNSTFVNVKSLRSIEGEPLVEIHPTGRRRARHRQRPAGACVQRPRRATAARPRSISARGPAWSTAWACGGASSAWTAPTSTS
jgi:hypothetical protein